MYNKLLILLFTTLLGCTQPSSDNPTTRQSSAAVRSYTLSAGFSVIEQQPDGYFIRISSAERASAATISAIATELAGKFDRVDICIDASHERGDEYLSIIGNRVFDYENDNIYTITL